jgi:glycogen synthase
MKVLMLGWELPPNNSGGLGVACLQLCKALSNKKVTVKFVLPYTAEHDIDFMEIIPATEKSAAEILFGAYDSATTFQNPRSPWRITVSTKSFFRQLTQPTPIPT